VVEHRAEVAALDAAIGAKQVLAEKSKNKRPTGDLVKAMPPWCPGAAQECSSFMV
jgi:hypothetical protein